MVQVNCIDVRSALPAAKLNVGLGPQKWTHTRQANVAELAV